MIVARESDYATVAYNDDYYGCPGKTYACFVNFTDDITYK